MHKGDVRSKDLALLLALGSLGLAYPTPLCISIIYGQELGGSGGWVGNNGSEAQQPQEN